MRHLVYLKFIKYLSPYIFYEIVLLFLLILTSLASLASPYFLKLIIDDVFPSKDYYYLLQVIFALLAIYILRIVASYFSDIVYANISSKVVADIRKDLFSHLLALPLSFFNKRPVGDIVHRLNYEVDRVQEVLANSIIRFINITFTIIGLVIALCLLNLNLFLVSCLVFPLIFATVALLTPKVRALYEKINQKEGHLQGYFQERISSVMLIKVMNAYGYENKVLDTALSSLIKERVNASKLSSINKNITTFLIAIGPLIVFLWGGKDVLLGFMSLGALVAFIQYLNRLYSPCMDIMNLYNDIIRASVSMDRIFELFNEKKLSDTQGYQALEKDIKEIRFENLSFKYEESGEYILKDINMQLQPGLTYGIKGPSGTGKSTLIKLLCQYYSPFSGAVLINGKDLSTINNSEWISRVHLVSQETFIFNGTFRYNINYSKEPTSDQELIAACEQSLLMDYISTLPLGLDTNLGERGNLLSGGQRQKVALARLFLNLNHALIILDEATSALDRETEETILRNLIAKKPASCILLIISHRESLFSQVDEVISIRREEFAL